MKCSFIILLCAVFSIPCTAQIEIMKGFDVGEYGVGFRSERITDYSRSYGDTYRSIQIFIWYPAKDKSQETLSFQQYYQINDPDGSRASLTNSEYLSDSLVVAEVKRLNEIHDGLVNLSKYKSLQTMAQPDATPSEGSYPLLLFAPGGNTSGQFHSVIAEYLASHGYLVISFPSLGNNEEGWPFNQIGLNIHMDDMAFIINHLQRSMSQVDIDKAGLIAWSVGGVSQAMYCMKNPAIDVLVSLDTGIGRVYGVEMLKSSPYFDYASMTIPYLHMTGDQPEMYKVARSTEFHDSIASVSKYSLIIDEFSHQHFAAQIGIIPALASEPEDSTIIDAYIRMCQLTRAFCDLYLKEESSGEAWQNMIQGHTKTTN